MSLTLYELAAADSSIRFSPHCWKIRMALGHKGLDAERVPWRFTDKAAIAASGQERVPVLVDDGMVISDSWQIAQHLEARYPDASLFEPDRTTAIFANAWSDRVLLPIFARIVVLDVHNCLADVDKAYFRASREARFGQSLENVVSDGQRQLGVLHSTLTPLRLALDGQPFLAGDRPGYADYSIFGVFMWARCVSEIELIDEEDPVWKWRDRLLDAFDGLAREAPRAVSGHATG